MLDPAWKPLTTFPRLHGATFALDLETHDVMFDTHGPGWCFADAGEVVGYALSWGDPGQRKKTYLPVGHRGGGNLDRRKVEAYIRDICADTSNTIIFHNRVYDEGWLRRTGIAVKAKTHDTRTAAPLVNEYQRTYSLDAISFRNLQRRKNEAPLEEFVAQHNAGIRAQAVATLPTKGGLRRDYIKANSWDAKGDLWQFPAYVVAPYAAEDAELTLDNWDFYQPLLTQDDLWGAYALESKILTILIEMRWRGVRVDLDYAERQAREFKLEEARLQKELDTMAGMPISVWEAESIAKAFDAAGLRYGHTPKTHKPSFRKEFLDEVDHPMGDLIRKVRNYNKTRTTFLEGYVLNKHVSHRIHGQFHPLKTEDGGAVTSRFSSSDPNLENLPSPDKNYAMGVAVRGCFLPEEGQLWAACDYSQQEPRLMVHFAGAARVSGAAAAIKAYIENPRMDFHAFMANLTGLPRTYAKNIFLGRAYGMGGAKYCKQVGLPTIFVEKTDRKTGDTYMQEMAGPEGQAQLDQFDQYAPFVKLLSKECEKRAKEHGYIKLIMGHRLHLSADGYRVEGKDYAYKMMNRLIQGSAAGQLKKAMCDAWDAGEVPLVPSHDELGFSVEDREHATRCGDLMVHAVTLRVPSAVDIELGPSWGATVKQEED